MVLIFASFSAQINLDSIIGATVPIKLKYYYLSYHENTWFFLSPPSVWLKNAIKPNFNLNPGWFAGVPGGYKFIRNITATAEIKTLHSTPATSWATATQWGAASSQALWWNTKQPAGNLYLIQTWRKCCPLPSPKMHTHIQLLIICLHWQTVVGLLTLTANSLLTENTTSHRVSSNG